MSDPYRTPGRQPDREGWKCPLCGLWYSPLANARITQLDGGAKIICYPCSEIRRGSR